MAVKTKAELLADSAALYVDNSSGDIEASEVKVITDDLIDSYENVIQSFTSAQRALISATEGLKIYNTDTNRYEFFDGTTWIGLSKTYSFPFDASSNPNYPPSQKGDVLVITLAGKIGGASGVNVGIGDVVNCIESNAGGTQASVGEFFLVNVSGSPAVTDAALPPLAFTTTYGIDTYEAVGMAGNTIDAVFRGGTKLVDDGTLYSISGDDITFLTGDLVDDEEILILRSGSVSGINLTGIRAIKQSSASGDLNPLSNYSTSPTVFATEVIDLTQTQLQSYNFPTGMRFYVSRIRIILTEVDNITGQPTIDLGDTDSITKYGTITTIGTAIQESKTLDLTDTDASTDFKFEITTGATADTMTGRIIVEGVAIENEA